MRPISCAPATDLGIEGSGGSWRPRPTAGATRRDRRPDCDFRRAAAATAEPGRGSKAAERGGGPLPG